MKEEIFNKKIRRRKLQNYEERIQNIFQQLHQPLFVNVFIDLQNRNEICFYRNGEHFEHSNYEDYQINCLFQRILYLYTNRFIKERNDPQVFKAALVSYDCKCICYIYNELHNFFHIAEFGETRCIQSSYFHVFISQN